MSVELYEDALGDARNARTLATASELAYLSAEPGVAAFRERLGLEGHLVSVDNHQGWVCSSPEHIVVAFRGTESPTSLDGLKDWLLTDAANLLMVPEGRLGTDLAAAGVGARFHQGFVTAIGSIWDEIYGRVAEEMKKEERPLWITGHSLGGAMALLAAWLFRRKFLAVHQVYTFGGPMIGNAEAAAAFDRDFGGRIFRYVNLLDPVPRLPTVSLVGNPYQHCQTEVAPAESASATESASAFLSSLASRTVDGVLNATLIDDIWNALQQRLAAHFLDSYQALVASLFKK